MKFKFIFLSLFLVFSFEQLNAQNSDGDKKLRNELGLSFSNLAHASLSYKIGAPNIYGVLQIGTNFNALDAPILGLGVGYSFKIMDKARINLEGKFLAYFYDNFNADKIDKAASIDVLFEYVISKRFKFTVGPNFSFIENVSGTAWNKQSIIPAVATFDLANNGNKGAIIIGARAGFYYTF